MPSHTGSKPFRASGLAAPKRTTPTRTKAAQARIKLAAEPKTADQQLRAKQ